VHSDVTDDARARSDKHAGTDRYEPGCWRDSDKADNSADAGTERRRLSSAATIKEDPGEHRCC
jgi:hypothetical protein